MKVKITYISNDGREFDNEKACLEHEDKERKSLVSSINLYKAYSLPKYFREYLKAKRDYLDILHNHPRDYSRISYCANVLSVAYEKYFAAKRIYRKLRQKLKGNYKED